MIHFSALQEKTKDITLSPLDRLKAFLQLALVVQDPCQIFAFIEDHKLSSDQTIYYLALADHNQRMGNFAQAIQTLEKGLKKVRDQDSKSIIAQHISILLNKIEQSVLKAIDQPQQKRRMRGQKPLSVGATSVQLNGFVVWVDKEYRQGLRCAELLQAYSRSCQQQQKMMRQKYQKELKKRPFSWLTRQLKKFKFLFLENQENLRESNRFSTPKQNSKSKSISKSDLSLTPIDLRNLESPIIMKQLLKARQSQNCRQPTKICAKDSPKFNIKVNRQVQCIRTAVIQDFSFSKMDNAMIEDSSVSSESEQIQLNALIRQSQLFFHPQQQQRKWQQHTFGAIVGEQQI